MDIWFHIKKLFFLRDPDLAKANVHVTNIMEKQTEYNCAFTLFQKKVKTLNDSTTTEVYHG